MVHSEAVEAVVAEARTQGATLAADPECGRAAAIFRAIERSPFLAELTARGGGYYMSTWSLFAAVQLIVARERPSGFVDYFADGAEATAWTSATFDTELERFCRDHEEELDRLVREHTCQMNEVNRCASALVPALAHIHARIDPRPMALIEVGTSAGLQLLFDRYAYDYGDGTTWRPPRNAADVGLECRLTGGTLPDLAPLADLVTSRVGVDRDPPTLDSPLTRAWIQASAGFRSGRTARLIELVRSADLPIVEGDAVDVIEDLILDTPAGVLPVVYNSASLIYFPPERQDAFREHLRQAAQTRDFVWISNETFRVDARDRVTTIQSAEVPPEVRAEILGGAFRVAVEVTSFRGGVGHPRLLAVAHPWGLWTRWLGES